MDICAVGFCHYHRTGYIYIDLIGLCSPQLLSFCLSVEFITGKQNLSNSSHLRCCLSRNPSHVPTPNVTPVSARKNILIKNGEVDVTSLTSLEDVGRLGRRTLSVPSMMNKSVVSFENNGSEKGSGTSDSSRRFGWDAMTPSIGVSTVANPIREFSNFIYHGN